MNSATLFAAPASTVHGNLPLGAVVGKISSSVTMAFSNNPCNTSLPPQTVVLLNASTNNASYNEIDPTPPAYSGSEGPLEMFRDDGNTNGLPQHVERYPAYLNRMFDPDRVGDINGDGDDYDIVNGVAENPGASGQDPYGVVDPVVPLARYSGSVKEGTTGLAIVVQLVIFALGALSAFQPPYPFADMSSTLGYPSLVVFQDPTGPSSPGDVNDICSPTETRILLWGRTRDNPCTGSTCVNDDTPCVVTCGDNSAINSLPALVDSGSPITCNGTNERGCVRYANPSTAGTHLFYAYQQSQRDADDDGKENALDTCPLTSDTLDPRTGAGPDTDGDRIANACDPTPGVNTNFGDHDLDGFLNTQDNCPLAANADQKESETVTPHATAAQRGGSRADGIGDVCDPNPTKADGHFHTVFSAIPKCIGSTDTDGDGWCNTTESSLDSSSSNAAATPEHPSIVTTFPLTNSGSGGTTASPGKVGEPKQACNDGIDNDVDGFIDAADGSFYWDETSEIIIKSGCQLVDTDGDAYGDGHEGFMGTLPLSRCGVGSWPPDFNDSQTVDITDINMLAPPVFFSEYPGPPYRQRYDLAPDGIIDISDVNLLGPVFFSSCTP